MKRGLFEALCVLAVAVWSGSCKEDPTASLSGTAASVQFEFRARNVTIADPTKTYAVARDAAGNQIGRASCRERGEISQVDVVAKDKEDGDWGEAADATVR